MNAISTLISKASDRLQAFGINFITTAVNPFLGFTGDSLIVSKFVPYATSPIAYNYNNNGEYKSRRQLDNILPKVLPKLTWAPPNILLIKGVSPISRMSLRNIQTIYKIDETLHNDITLSEKKISFYNLDKLRSELEMAWSNITRYHLTPIEENDPISKGQCGVTSAYLANIFEGRGYEVYFCEGDLHFTDNTPSILRHCWLKIPEYKTNTINYKNLIIDFTAVPQFKREVTGRTYRKFAYPPAV